MYKSKSLIHSFKHAFSGMAFAFFHEKNFKIHLTATVLVIGLGLYVNLSALRWVLLLLQIALVLSVEMINSAFERTVDMIISEYHTEAKRIKDMAAGAVLVVSLTAVINGFLIFFVR